MPSRLLALAVVLLGHTASAQTAPALFDVFVVAGQSNAEGRGDAVRSPTVPAGVGYVYHTGIGEPVQFGPMQGDPVGDARTGSPWPTFVNEYHARTGRGVILVEAAFGGTSLVAGLPNTSEVDWSPTGSLFDWAVRDGRDALSVARAAGIEARFVGWLWAQGEADAHYGIEARLLTGDDYRTAWRAFQRRFRAEVPGARLFVSQLGRLRSHDLAGYAAIRQIQAEEIAVPWGAGGPVAEIAYAGAVGFPGRGMMGDEVHYNQAGLNEIGYAMAVFAATSPAVAVDPAPVAAEALAVYPNPARDVVTVRGPAGEVEVVDVLGRVVARGRAPSVDVSAIPAGAYSVRSSGRHARLVVAR